jgi:hypothetical protein
MKLRPVSWSLAVLLWTLAVLLLTASAALAATEGTGAQLTLPDAGTATGPALSASRNTGARCTADPFQLELPGLELPGLSPSPSPLAFTPCGSCSIPDCVGGVSGQTACTSRGVKGKCILSPKLCLPNRSPQCVCSAGL